MVRLVRLIRFVKLYKAASTQPSGNKKSVRDMLEERRKKKQMNLVYPDGTNNNLLTQHQQNQNGNAPGSPRNRTGSKQLDPNSLPQPMARPSQAMIQMEQPPPQEPEDEGENLKESRVSKKLSDLTTKRVIIIVLLLLFIMPLFSADYFFDPPKSVEFACRIMKDITESSKSSHADIGNLMRSIVDQHAGLSQTIAQIKLPFDWAPYGG